jgi:hypothetical protein
MGACLLRLKYRVAFKFMPAGYRPPSGRSRSSRRSGANYLAYRPLLSAAVVIDAGYRLHRKPVFHQFRRFRDHVLSGRRCGAVSETDETFMTSRTTVNVLGAMAAALGYAAATAAHAEPKPHRPPFRKVLWHRPQGAERLCGRPRHHLRRHVQGRLSGQRLDGRPQRHLPDLNRAGEPHGQPATPDPRSSTLLNRRAEALLSGPICQSVQTPGG